MQKNTKRPLQEFNSIQSNDIKNKKKKYEQKVIVIKKYYKNCTFNK